jgi:hypothetical protein
VGDTVSAKNVTIIDVEGRWILEWPQGQATVEVHEEVLRRVVTDHNTAHDEIDRLRAENARLKALVDFALENGDA